MTDKIKEFAIRSAQAADVPQLVELIGQLAAHHGDTATASPDFLHQDLFGQTPWISMLVAEAASQLVGYAALCPLYRAQFSHRGIDLHHLYVTPEHRTQGVGTALVKAGMDMALARRCTYFLVAARADNLEAQRFYERLGFTRSLAGGVRFTKVLDGG